jgi:hypothetical protein
VKSSSINICYAAHTASCTFLLDADGICRRVVMAPKGKRRESSRTAARCVGAQYVASLDGIAAGGLVEMPRVGAALLFARVDESGRVSLVRTGALTSFESMAAEDPFVESCSVETSAPEVVFTPRAPSAGEPAEDDYASGERTQRIPALRPEQIAAALADEDAEHELATSEYRAVSQAAPSRAVLPPIPSVTRLHGSTLRSPHRDATIEGDDDYAHAEAPVRGMLPRRNSDPQLRIATVRPAQGRSREAASTARRLEIPDPAQTPRAIASDVQIAARRRRGS